MRCEPAIVGVAAWAGWRWSPLLPVELPREWGAMAAVMISVGTATRRGGPDLVRQGELRICGARPGGHLSCSAQRGPPLLGLAGTSVARSG
ncbi:hypothetical protein, partial [Micromonospora sp. NPDC093244]|uniref:hypothetical protein n=1 Tax=Micromonospora sp. NPDC093244 TaxID=3155071 RepID=UPI003423BCBA